MGSPERELCPPPATEEDELTLPRASINKMIKEIVPSIRVANESRELILNCCTEFIHLLSSEANEVCNLNNKKTINAEHILAGKYYNFLQKGHVTIIRKFCKVFLFHLLLNTLFSKIKPCLNLITIKVTYLR